MEKKMRIIESEYEMFYNLEHISIFDVNECELCVTLISGKTHGFCEVDFKSFGDNEGKQVEMSFNLKMIFVREMISFIYNSEMKILYWSDLEKSVWDKFLKEYDKIKDSKKPG
jgi:hypothetical protein